MTYVEATPFLNQPQWCRPVLKVLRSPGLLPQTSPFLSGDDPAFRSIQVNGEGNVIDEEGKAPFLMYMTSTSHEHFAIYLEADSLRIINDHETRS